MREAAQNKRVTLERPEIHEAIEEQKRSGKEGMLARAKMRRRAKNKLRRTASKKNRG